MRALLRPVAVVAAGLVTTTMLQAPAQAAPADRSAGWLEKQLTNKVVHNDQFDFDDLGLTIDVALALEEVGGHRRTVRQISRAVADGAAAYTAPEAGEVYAGATAKAAVLAVVANRDPRAFGGLDLVTQLENRTDDEGADRGRISDESQFGDFANTLGQVFAVWALARTGSPEAGAARGFLLDQQCEAGFFRVSFSDPAAPDQTCDGDPAAAPNVDVTALAVIGLDALPRKGRQVRRAMADATAWLKSAQRRNGSFAPGDSDLEGPNSNSTGLAGWALGETGSCARARKAAGWVKKLQVAGRLRGTPYAGERGAIAYDRAGYAAGESDGITVESQDQWRRATAQAAPALRFVRGC